MLGLVITYLDGPAATWSHEHLHRPQVFNRFARYADPLPVVAAVCLASVGLAAALGHWKSTSGGRTLVAACVAVMAAASCGSSESSQPAGRDAGIDGTSCTPTTCKAAGAQCGSVGDGCGGMLDCGSCQFGMACGAGGTPNRCGVSEAGCTPKTCAELGATCGPMGDGCGGTLQCGTCPSGQTCGGGGIASV